MKRIIFFILYIILAYNFAYSQFRQLGVPFFKNYYATDYNANSRNFDIAVDGQGHVFVANFEGLMYYDQALWHMIHLKSLTRPTSLFIDSNETLWVGGYKYFGRAIIADNGALDLQEIDNMSSVQGEVLKIWEKNKKIFFVAENDTVYEVRGNKVEPLNKYDVKKEDNLEDINVVSISNGLKAVTKIGEGLSFYTDNDQFLCKITEQNGLCSNNINSIAYNGKGILWAATDNGVFSVGIPSSYSYFSNKEGLIGEVYSMHMFGETTYVGTTSGLYSQNGLFFEHINGVNHLCWAFAEMDNSLLVASEGGLFIINDKGRVEKLTNEDTKSIFVNGDVFYTGEGKGVFLNKLSGIRYKISDQQNVTQILMDDRECLWIKTLYGEIWYRTKNQASFTKYKKNINKDNSNELLKATLVKIDGKVVVVDILDNAPFPYPQFSYSDMSGNLWLTDKENNNIYVWKNGKKLHEYEPYLYSFCDVVIRSMFIDKKQIWLGGESGVFVIDRSVEDPSMTVVPSLHICSVLLNGDSVLWGGFGKSPQKLPVLTSKDNNLLFTFALDYQPLHGSVLYKFRMDNNQWSVATNLNYARFNDQRPGKHMFQVKAIDAIGRETEVTIMNFEILPPFYFRWYMFVLYGLLIGIVVYMFIRWRISRLEDEKNRLESIVNERTAEVVKQRDEIVKQKDEIEEKSNRLESALTELNQAQHELIRQEKMATVGKLTQGLIDRILNPLNYINNFTKLSIGLLKDVKDIIEDEKEVMKEDNYEDTVDVLGMLSTNLEKVGEHGQNTTRTLKAMEEMLKDRSGGIVPMDLAVVIRQNQEMLKTYYASVIASNNISISFNIPNSELLINGNADQLSKTFMSILANSVYAITKKKQQKDYIPEISFSIDVTDNDLILKIRDNGIGIEDTIIDKVFDPFFTTKTTGEAAGVGLYLSREIIQNHQGDISVKSVKNEYTEFTIVLPKIK